jgi:hypothetical protein
MMVKNSRITILRLNALHGPMAMNRPKSQKFKIGHDGILSIGNFILMIFSCPVTDQQPILFNLELFSYIEGLIPIKKTKLASNPHNCFILNLMLKFQRFRVQRPEPRNLFVKMT